MNSTKLLLITSEFPPQPGGIGNHALNLAISLQNEGYDLTVQTNARSTNGQEEAQFDQKLPFLVVRAPRHQITIRTYLKRFMGAKSLIKEHEVILASGKFSIWLVGIWSLFYSRKFIAVVHGSELRLSNRILQQFTQFCLKKCKRLIAVSNFTKHMLPHELSSHALVIPNGFSIGAMPEAVNDSSNPRLITVGNVTRRKGQHHVVNGLAMALQKYPALTYTMVGIPTEQSAIESLAAVLGVTDAIQFTGKVSEEDKITHLRASTIFVMLSETTAAGDVEGFGIAILEANALGIPAIGALGCGIEDAIDHGNSGLLIDGSDVHSLIDAIEEITTNYEHFSKEAVVWSKRFGWDTIVKHYVKVIESV